MKFKVGDTIREIETGDTCVIKLIDGMGNLWGDWSNGENNVKLSPEDCEPVSPSKIKPQKKCTETDRRKAAKAVRELEKKLNAALKKASDTGIKIAYRDDGAERTIELTYQPETPKMRKY